MSKSILEVIKNGKICKMCEQECKKLFTYVNEDEELRVCSVCIKKKKENYESMMVNYLKKDADIGPYMSLIGCHIKGDSCATRARPDLLISSTKELCIFVECDERQHTPYPSVCEKSRHDDLIDEIKEARIVIIRWNPDNYIRKGKRGIAKLNERLFCLSDLIKYLTKKKDWEDHEMINLYYLYYNDHRKDLDFRFNMIFVYDRYDFDMSNFYIELDDITYDDKEEFKKYQEMLGYFMADVLLKYNETKRMPRTETNYQMLAVLRKKLMIPGKAHKKINIELKEKYKYIPEWAFKKTTKEEKIKLYVDHIEKLKNENYEIIKRVDSCENVAKANRTDLALLMANYICKKININPHEYKKNIIIDFNDDFLRLLNEWIFSVFKILPSKTQNKIMRPITKLNHCLKWLFGSKITTIYKYKFVKKGKKFKRVKNYIYNYNPDEKL